METPAPDRPTTAPDPAGLPGSGAGWGAREWILLGCGLALYLAVARPFFGSFADDAYISLRYAQSWAEGCGPRYNCGEPAVEGYTNFLWMAIGAAAIRAGVDPVPVLRWLGLAAGFATLWLAALLCRRVHRGPLATAVPLVGFAASPFWAVNAVSGLETAAAGASVIGAVLLSLDLPGRRRPWLAGLAWGVSYLLRPEGILLALLSGIYGLARGLVSRLGARATIRGTLSFAAGFLCLAVPYFLWRFHYYGAVYPNSFAAKHLPLELVLGSNLRILGTHALFFSSLLGSALIVLAARRRFEHLYLVALALASAGVSLSVQNNVWMPGHRLYLSASLLLAVLGAGVADLGRDAGAARWKTALRSAPVILLVGVLLVCAWRGHPETASLAREHYAPDLAPARSLGRRIGAMARPGEWLAIRDAGMVPYFAGTGVKVLDTHERSLNDRIIVRDGWELSYVLARDLRFIVLVSFSPTVFVLAHPVEQSFLTPDLFQRYRLVTVATWHPRRHFFLFERVAR
jgi:hypothetical protein